MAAVSEANNTCEINVFKTKINKIFVTTARKISGKQSFCWTHFGQLSIDIDGKRRTVLGEQVFCGVCLSDEKTKDDNALFSKARVKAYSKTIATGNLLRHLKDDHGIEDAQKKNTPIAKFFSPRRKPPSTSGTCRVGAKNHDKWLLCRDLALWFARSLLPFDSVDNDAMIDFFKKYHVIISDQDLQTRQNIAREGLGDVYDSMFSYIKAFIQKQNPRFGALTADMWTDQYRRRHYITCTYHFISEEMQLMKYTLATKQVSKKHTGETIRDELKQIWQNFELQHKDMYLVTDAGSNMKRAANLLGLKNHLCLGHALHNLVTVDGVQDTEEIFAIVQKCKKIVKRIRYRAPQVEAAATTEQLNLLTSIEELDQRIGEDADESESENELHNSDNDSSRNLPPPTIKTSTPTRWHSTLMMLQSLNHPANRRPINAILTEIGKNNLYMTNSEHEMLGDVIKFLEKFKKVVEVMSSETQPTINLALIFRSEIKRLLTEAGDDEPIIITRLKNNMLRKLDHRFPLTDIVITAALLDCRFHSIGEIDDYMEKKNTTKVAFLTTMIKNRLSRNDVHEHPEAAPASDSDSTTRQGQDTSTSNLLMNLARKHGSVQHDFESLIDSECWKYFSTSCPEDIVPYNGNILDYWKDKKKAMPYLFALARSCLGIPATSTPSERVFSVAGQIITAKRARLNPLRVNKILFIHDNYKICKDALSFL